MTVTNMYEVFSHELADVYDAEHRLLEDRKERVQSVSNQELLGDALQENLNGTEGRPHKECREGIRAARGRAVARDLSCYPGPHRRGSGGYRGGRGRSGARSPDKRRHHKGRAL